MELKHYPVEKLKKEILDVVGKYLDLKKYKVFFFGSRVEGTNDESSDIDIGVEGPKPVPFDALSSIKEEIAEISTVYLIDLIDFKNSDKDFGKIAKKYIEIIN